MQSFMSIRLKTTLTINRLYSFYYFHFAEEHVFPGEKHDFWELVYIDQGQIEIGADDTHFMLRQGQLTLHRPNEFHQFTVRSAKNSMLVVGFDCSSPAIHLLGQRVFTLNTQEKKLLLRLLQEGELCFGEILDSAYTRKLTPLRSAPQASQQMLRLYIEQLMILLLRDIESEQTSQTFSVSLADRRTSSLPIDQISQFMSEHLDGSLHFEDICRISGMSSTALKSYFKEQTGMTVMNYYQRQRINKARRLLRDSNMNITQISELLGYSSLHSFSHQFKRITGLSPTDYLKTIIYK